MGCWLMRNILKSLIIFGCLFSPFYGYSQYCVSHYNQAQNLYNQGKVDSVLIILKPCLSNRRLLKRTPSNVRTDIYKLAANASILLDNPDSAKYYIDKFLAEKPFYAESPDDNDLIGFKAAVDTTLVHASWLIGLRSGFNLTIVDPIKRFSVLEFDGPVPRRNYTTEFFDFDDFGFLDYREILAYQIGLVLERVIFSPKTSISLEPTFTKLKFEYDINYPELDDLTFNYSQKVSHLMLPLIAKYKFLPGRKLRPYLEAGVFGRILLSASKVVESTSHPSASSTSPPLFRGTPETPVTDLMNKFYTGLALGTGLTWNIKNQENIVLKNSSLSLNVRYTRSWGKYNDEKRRFLNNNLSDAFLYEFYDAVDDLKLRSLEFSLIWTYHLDYKVFKR